jgi:hypothetical protein
VEGVLGDWHSYSDISSWFWMRGLQDGLSQARWTAQIRETPTTHQASSLQNSFGECCLELQGEDRSLASLRRRLLMRINASASK